MVFGKNELNKVDFNAETGELNIEVAIAPWEEEG